MLFYLFYDNMPINWRIIIMLERTITPFIKSLSKGFPVLLLTGPRQVGKTSLLKEIKEPSRKYISLDDLQLREFAKNDPKLFIETYTPPIIIDEVQYAPEIFPYIKMYVDSNKTDGLFWLTGSQKFSLMKGIQESLAGRIAIIDMLGLSYMEIAKTPFESTPFLPSLELLKKKNRKTLTPLEMYNIIWKGSFPKPLVNKKTKREAFLKEYIQTYINRDVRDDIGVNNELKFYNFIRAVAARTANLLNYADIAKDVNINEKTVRIWLKTLERLGIIKLLEPYSSNIAKRVVKTPKVYFLDTGLCAYLTKWDTPDSLLNGAMNGSILETYVFAEIIKNYWHNGEEESIYFYRDSNKKEIDFIIEKNLTLYPIEVKKTSMPIKSDIKNFFVLNRQSKKVGTGAIICFCNDVSPIANDVISVPIWEI